MLASSRLRGRNQRNGGFGCGFVRLFHPGRVHDKAVDEHEGPVYQASRANRAAAWVVLALAVAVAVRVNVSGGGASVKTLALGAVCLVVAFLAAAALRFLVRADPEHLVVCWGGPVRRIPWSQVKGFGIDERTGRDVFVVLADKRKRRLPLVEVSSRRIPANEVRDALQRYWKTHRR
jgi:hypothetical protein